MGRIPARLLRQLGQDILIEPYRGVGVDGAEIFDAAVAVRAIVEETDRLERTAEPDGDQGVMAIIRCALSTDCPSGSRVTLASGRQGLADTVQHWDGGSTNAPSHLQIAIKGTVTA